MNPFETLRPHGNFKPGPHILSLFTRQFSRQATDLGLKGIWSACPGMRAMQFRADDL